MSNVNNTVYHRSNSLGNHEAGLPSWNDMVRMGAELVSYKPFGDLDRYDLVWRVPSMWAYNKARSAAERELRRNRHLVSLQMEAQRVRDIPILRVRDYRRTR